jgi:fatty acid desaturase
MVALTIGHDGNHFAITHKPWVWRASTTVADCIVGLSSLTWTYQHTYGHHVYTNIDGSDPDVETDNEKPDFWRIKPFQNWFPKYRFQHIYMPFLYSVIVIKMKLQDFHTFFTMEKSNIRINPLSTYQFVAFFTEKALHVLYRFLIPLLYMPLPSLLLMNLIVDIVMGLWMGIVTQFNHINTKVSWPSPPDQSRNNQIYFERNWEEMQIASTIDYATDSWFWTVFIGALNHQVAHHLFPGVLQTYYPQITPIVKKTCAEFGLSYFSLPSTWDAMCYHLGYLKAMGATPKPQTK